MSAYTKFTQYISKHALLSTLIMVLALGTVSASAAQLFGPENIKPFKTAKSENSSSSLSSSVSSTSSSLETEKDIFKQTLFADNDNELSTLEKCNLRVKYSKVITLGTGTEKVKVAKENAFQQFNSEIWKRFLPATEGLDKFYVQMSGEPYNSGPGFGFSSLCFDEEYKFSDFNLKFSSEQGEGFTFDADYLGKIEYTQLPKKEFCSNIGLVSLSCDKINNFQKILRPGAGADNVYYYFTYDSKTYLFDLGRINNIKLQSEFTKKELNNSSSKSSAISISSISSQTSQTSEKWTGEITLAPKNLKTANGLEIVRTVNIANMCDIGSGVPGLVLFGSIDGAENVGDMKITNKNLQITQDQKVNFQKDADIINKKIDFQRAEVEPYFYNLNVFDTSCFGGGSYYYLYEINNLEYKNVDNYKIFVGNRNVVGDQVGDTKVIIIAKKGDNIIQIEKIIHNTQQYGDIIVPLAKSCSKNYPFKEYSDFNSDCFINKLKTNSQIKADAQKVAQELIQTFAL